MPKGISLHIGINRVDKNKYYPLSVPELMGCENDALDMRSLATKVGYQASAILSEAATYQSVTNAILDTAARLAPGDIFLLTYSGHGSQVFDSNGDESDRLDETWVLYDDQLLDDELYNLWSKFALGVRIVVLSDSCHSGTISRSNDNGIGAKLEVESRKINSGLNEKTIFPVMASGILISACRDNQVALEIGKNGLFTSRLIEVWNNGAYKGTYRQFRNAIASRLPKSQSPNYFLFGATNPRFVKQLPFKI